MRDERSVRRKVVLGSVGKLFAGYARSDDLRSSVALHRRSSRYGCFKRLAAKLPASRSPDSLTFQTERSQDRHVTYALRPHASTVDSEPVLISYFGLRAAPLSCKLPSISARSPGYEPRSGGNFRTSGPRSRHQTKTQTGSQSELERLPAHQVRYIILTYLRP